MTSLDDLDKSELMLQDEGIVKGGNESTTEAFIDVIEKNIQYDTLEIQQTGEESRYVTLRDSKNKISKYKRWSPKMDQFLIKLLVDVSLSFEDESEAKLTKKGWGYITSSLRNANPETVYSTYTKYSCQQHLFNVIHQRYKMWFRLVLHEKSKDLADSLNILYQWNVNLGKFEIFDILQNKRIVDERQIKSLIYGGLSLPALNNFNKASLLLSELFLTDNLGYLSLYHSKVLPLLLDLDPRYGDELGEIYKQVPKIGSSMQQHCLWQHQTQNLNNGMKLLSPPSRKRNRSYLQETQSSETPDNTLVDPRFKSKRQRQYGSRQQEQETFINNSSNLDDNDLATAAIAAINSPSVFSGKDMSTPLYVRDRKWFNKLLALNEIGLLSTSELLGFCEGVRDGKIPIFMLNILDQDYYPNKDEVTANDIVTDDIVVKRIREFILPLVFFYAREDS